MIHPKERRQTMNNYTEIMNIIDKQEQMLRLDHFSSDFALEFGLKLVERAKNKGVALGFSIRKINGAILFQHMMEGANTANTQNWLRRKAGMAGAWEHSSLYMWAREQATGQTVQYNGLDPNECVQRGGGFPLFLKSGEFVGIVSASGLAHNEDHQFIVDTLAEYLGVEGVPVPEIE